jgi:hypothetical protein
LAAWLKAGLGPGTSPILYKNLVTLQGDLEMGSGSFIVGLDRRTGGRVGKTEPQNRSWATPLLVETAERTELLTAGAEAVIRLRPRTQDESSTERKAREAIPFPASPVAFGDKILLTSEDGDTFVLGAGPVHATVRTNSIDEPACTSPALANGMVFIRGARHLFAIK